MHGKLSYADTILKYYIAELISGGHCYIQYV